MVAAPSKVQQPIRAEVYGIDRLRQHAEALAAAQPVADEREEGRQRLYQHWQGRRILPRVQENGRVLLAGYRSIVEAVRQKSQITQAEEWLLDNFHVVDGQLREIRDHLPRSFYKVLPKIAEGHRISTRHPGKRRPVHSRGDLVGHGVRSAWRRRHELRTLQPT